MSNETIDKLKRLNAATLGFIRAFESVDKDRSGKDPDKSHSKRAIVDEIKDLVEEEKQLLEEISSL